MAEEETQRPATAGNAPKDKKEWASKSNSHMTKGRNLTRDIMTRLRENDIAEAANKMAAMENANREKEMKKKAVYKQAAKHGEVISTSFKCIQDIEDVILQTEDSCSKLRHEKYAGFAALQVCQRRLELRESRPAAETFDDSLHRALNAEKKLLESFRAQIEKYEKEGEDFIKGVLDMRAKLSRDTGERRLAMAHDFSELKATIAKPPPPASAALDLQTEGEGNGEAGAEGADGPASPKKEEAPKEAPKEEAPKEEAGEGGEGAPSPKNGANPKVIIDETNLLLNKANQFRAKTLQYVQEVKIRSKQAGAFADECLAKRCHELTETKKKLEQSALDVDAAIDTASRALGRTQKRCDPRDKKKQAKLESDMAVLQALKDNRKALQDDIRNKFAALEIDNMCRRVTPAKADAAKAEREGKLGHSQSSPTLGMTNGSGQGTAEMQSTAATTADGNEKTGDVKLPPIEGATA